MLAFFTSRTAYEALDGDGKSSYARRCISRAMSADASSAMRSVPLKAMMGWVVVLPRHEIGDGGSEDDLLRRGLPPNATNLSKIVEDKVDRLIDVSRHD